ncbi:NF-kappa-B inhibitor-interacting Ras-like protein 1 isoform X1 [Motacilla alba alba]|uniref:NF-kappa-B inhibitor-interacting Ras-like protein 1 isoform X1 n=1 Tax=Motacilla alba alba TaxID=1094192 RepID=UPI0018D55B07|nr:NF-kappa-B inhibitor-interacting Ras-like protein 1 isoform X1 [Motacilla alba alba]
MGGGGGPRGSVGPAGTSVQCMLFGAPWLVKNYLVKLELKQHNASPSWSRKGLEEGATMEDVYLASVETDRGVKEQLRLYDTRGLQEGVELPKHYFSVADAFVLVYAVTSLEAFQRVELLKKEIDVFRDKKEVAVIVLGNKTDLLDQRQVETEAAQQWARAEKVRLWEVTVTDRKTLLEPFTFLASKLSQSQNKSTFPLPGRKSKGNNCEN